MARGLPLILLSLFRYPEDGVPFDTLRATLELLGSEVLPQFTD